jgi:hypothetical protein
MTDGMGMSGINKPALFSNMNSESGTGVWGAYRMLGMAAGLASKAITGFVILMCTAHYVAAMPHTETTWLLQDELIRTMRRMSESARTHPVKQPIKISV